MEALTTAPEVQVRFRVESEIGPLRRAIVHRPGPELAHLPPSNANEPLFDDLAGARRAREEHDILVDALRERDVEVLEFGQFLRETLADPIARTWLLARVVNERQFGPALANTLRATLMGLPAGDLEEILIAGLMRSEAPEEASGFFYETLGPTDFILQPLPHHVFTRDTSCWIADGVCISSMTNPARQRESLHAEAVYRFHPDFVDHSFPVWYGCEERDHMAAPLGCGDILVVGNGVVLVGVGQHTTPQAAELLARRLFAAQAARRVIAISLPKERRPMHLDTMLTMIDHDLFLASPGLGANCQSWTLTSGGSQNSRVRVQANGDLFVAIAEALGHGPMRVVTAGGDTVEAESEQWEEGNRVLAVAPGVVIAYERDVDTNRRLRRAGIEVVSIPGGEPGRGRGGPRRMTCPVERALA